jgi:hypothetical protein
MLLTTGSYTASGPYIELSRKRERFGWYRDPSDPSKDVYLRFTKVKDGSRRRYDGEEDLNSYLYGSRLRSVVVLDHVVRKRRESYSSESEDMYCPYPIKPGEPTRRAHYFLLAVKYSSARYVLVGTDLHVREADEAGPPSEFFHPSAADDYAEYEAEYDDAFAAYERGRW